MGRDKRKKRDRGWKVDSSDSEDVGAQETTEGKEKQKTKKRSKKRPDSSDSENIDASHKRQKVKTHAHLMEETVQAVVDLSSSSDEQNASFLPHSTEVLHPSDSRYEEDIAEEPPHQAPQPAMSTARGASAMCDSKAAAEFIQAFLGEGRGTDASPRLPDRRPKKPKKGKEFQAEPPAEAPAESPAEVLAEHVKDSPQTPPSKKQKPEKKAKGPSRSKQSKYFGGDQAPSAAESGLKAWRGKAAASDGGDLSTPPPAGCVPREGPRLSEGQEPASPSISAAREENGGGGAGHSHESPATIRSPLTQEPMPHAAEFMSALEANMQANSARKKKKRQEEMDAQAAAAEKELRTPDEAPNTQAQQSSKAAKKAAKKKGAQKAEDIHAISDSEVPENAGEGADGDSGVEAQDPDRYEDGGSYHDPKVSLWIPPASGFSLIEEMLYNDVWRLLVACMLLNKTSGKTVRRILWQLFELAPDPKAAMEADPQQVEAIIRPLGLFRKRTAMFRHFSKCYQENNWSDPRELPGIGQYACDAYRIFCRNEWRKMNPPADKDLRKYYDFLKETDGQGKGFERERFQLPTSNSASHDPHCWQGYTAALCPAGGDVHDISSPCPTPSQKIGDDITVELDKD